MRLPLLTLALVVLALVGCGRFPGDGFDLARCAADTRRRSTIKLADYTAFQWDRVHTFRPYASDNVVAEETGTEVPFPGSDSERFCLLVFLLNGKVVMATEVERKVLDFADVYRKGGYSQSEAVFTLAYRGAERWPYLQTSASSPSEPAFDPPTTP